MSEPIEHTFSEAREGDVIQLLDYEGGWSFPARLVAAPEPCRCLCGGLVATSVLPHTGARLLQHGRGDHPIRFVERAAEAGESGQ